MTCSSEAAVVRQAEDIVKSVEVSENNVRTSHKLLCSLNLEATNLKI